MRTVLYTFILLLFFPVFLAGKNNYHRERLHENVDVKIRIFSKYEKRAREGTGKVPSLYFKYPVTVLTRDNSLIHETKGVSFVFKNGVWYIYLDDREVINPKELRIVPGDVAAFRVTVGKEQRKYPLPLLIKIENNQLYLITNENLLKYSLHSARAELGPVKKTEQEALHALALIIKGRLDINLQRSKNSLYNVTDLTNTHVYKGILSTPEWNSAWEIDKKRLPGDLFFHANSGGRTDDQRVFGHTAKGFPGIRDWLYRYGTELGKSYTWKQDISLDEVTEILKNHDNVLPNGLISHITQNPSEKRILLTYKNEVITMAPETFRLAINRVRGWNFIKSNNYSLNLLNKGRRRTLIFKGYGLGHNAGLSQVGALELSRRGYSRYEILQHYYKDITFTMRDRGAVTPNCTYLIFDLKNGMLEKTNWSNGILKRTVPPGSLFKLIVYMYCAKERPDLLDEYHYRCEGKKNCPVFLPRGCWSLEGHGLVSMDQALSHSCNLFFASLHNKIDQKAFGEFVQELNNLAGVSFAYNKKYTSEEWAQALAGLDFSLSWSIKDLISLTSFLSQALPVTKKSAAFSNWSPNWKHKLYSNLLKTFTMGTASEEPARYGRNINYVHLKKLYQKNYNPMEMPGLWGKTSTVIDGTNIPVSYGIFIGGQRSRGIIVLLKYGNGHLAAHWGAYLLSKEDKIKTAASH